MRQVVSQNMIVIFYMLTNENKYVIQCHAKVGLLKLDADHGFDVLHSPMSWP